VRVIVAFSQKRLSLWLHSAFLTHSLPGVGVPKEFKSGLPLSELRESCRSRNSELLRSLRKDKHVDCLVREMKQEAKEGLMTDLMSADSMDHDSQLLASRFGMEQGTRDDGTPKIRACDNETQSGCNPATEPSEKLRCDGIDWICGLAMIFHKAGIKNMKLWKADIAKAYRRIPVDPDDHWLMWVCLLVAGKPMVARHNAMPFGAIGEPQFMTCFLYCVCTCLDR
jgi:hypothetical protein